MDSDQFCQDLPRTHKGTKLVEYLRDVFKQMRVLGLCMENKRKHVCVCVCVFSPPASIYFFTFQRYMQS